MSDTYRIWLKDDEPQFDGTRMEAAAAGLHRGAPRRRLSELEKREAVVAAREWAVAERERTVDRDERSWRAVAALLICCLCSLLIGATLLWPLVRHANQAGWFGRATAHAAKASR